MTARIDSIYCFDYTKDIGHYDSIRDFASVEMTYIGLALSTPKIRVNATPTSFDISSEGSSRIREYAISQMANLREISKDLAVNSPKYIFIKYFDGAERYFEYNESFYALFKIAFQYKPQEKMEDTYVSPYAIQKNESVAAPTYTKPQQTTVNSTPYAAQNSYNQQYNTSRPVQTKKKKSFSWGKFFFIGMLIWIVIVVFSNMTAEEPDAGLTPVTEPKSGAILSGSEVYDGSELTVTAASGESCLVKLKTRSGTVRMSFYVRAGDTVTVGVPAEYLYVYFAAGDTWYGSTLLFGEDTSYSMDDEICDFTEYTWEYTLYPVTNGNFSQTPIDAEDF